MPNPKTDRQRPANDGGPAFPVPAYTRDAHAVIERGWDAGFTGMSLRDWFAGQLLPAAFHAAATDDASCAVVVDRGKEKNMASVEYFASVAYQFADAMIAEREKRNA